MLNGVYAHPSFNLL